jgi:predicted nicotinamide N-methyase
VPASVHLYNPLVKSDPAHIERLRQRLLQRIRRKYKIITQAMEIGTVRFPFTRVENADAVLDQVALEEDRREKRSGHRQLGDDLHLPYWAELWDSAHGIAQFLASPQGRRLLKKPNATTTVLDLGCGMGLSGVVAAALGAEVTFADLEPAALLFARLNSLAWFGSVRARRVNWRTNHLKERFDVIIGADILYERAQWPHLEQFWRNHLADGGIVLLGEPGRQTGDLFVEWIGDKGWIMERFSQAVHTRATPIRMFHLQRAAQ